MLDALVVNASPLIFLGNGGQLDLLRAAGAARILVPQTVLDEVVNTPHADEAARLVSSARWIERAAPVPVPSLVIEWDLGPGESAVIATALATPGSCAVIEDLAGRKCALSLGVGVMGTLGVVIAARRSGAIADARRVLLDLRASGMWLADATMDMALRLAGEPR